MPTPLQPGGPASGPPLERKRRRKRDDPQSSAALEPDDDDGEMSPEEEPRNAPAAPAAPTPAPSSAPAPTSPPAAPDAVDLTSHRDSPPLSSDVERFDGKIVYNPDGSAYIIEDPELSEGETSISDLPKIEPGCIVDSRDNNVLERQLEFPQIASAFYVSRNSSLYGALYGRLAAERVRARPDAPVMHSYRVFSFRGGKDALRPPSPPAECPISVPVKPILMCFICKLSFGYAKSFVAHAQSDHSLSLIDSERDALSRENASAIIQCVGKDKEALVSFLEPVGAAAPPRMSSSGSPANMTELPSPSVDKRQDFMTSDRDNDSIMMNGTCDDRKPSPITWRPPRSIAESMIPQHSLISVAHPHAINASVQPRASPNSSPPFQATPPAFLSGTTIGVCPDHLGGRPSGADCPKCELILNSGRLGGPLAGMHSRNSCKTLKCPKCNWHYKYQETLEIHMKEKHPEAETSCIYCIAGQPHPRLARGETYTCGYKPYRCEVCNYSTTTKGNLSIHMQSDKHLNNMQELQNGGNPGEGNLPPAPQHTPPGPHKPPLPHHSPLGQKPKPTFRCDVCNYETNVARNLRIHMTSEKHTHNMLVLQQNVKHMQTLSALHHRQQNQQQLESLLHFHGGDAPPQNPEAALADMAYNQALMIQLMTGGPGPSPPELGAHLDVGLNPEAMEPPPEPADPEPERTYHCCICNCFSTDSLEALGHHLAQDRTKIREQEILALVAGHYVCKLCTYKTNLKANFQLHCKTDKHLQRLQHVNHVKEGGPRNEWKLKFCGGVGTGGASVGGVQVRCCACDYYTNSAHKLQLHAAGARHEAAALLLRHLRECASRIPRERPRVYRCALCGFGAPHRLPLLQHVRSVKHLQMEQIHQLQRRSEGKDPTPDVAELFQVIPQPSELSSPYDHQENDNKEPMDQKPELTQEQKMMRFLEQHQQQQQQQQQLLQQQQQVQQLSQQGPSDRDEERETPGTHTCPYCNFSCTSESRLHAHVTSVHSENTRHFICPLCQDNFKERSALERHVMQIHSVNSEGLQRLLLLVDQSHWLNGGQSQREESRQGEDEREISSPRSEGSADGEMERCSTCNRTFRNVDELCQHQNESGHLELKQTPQGPGYVCWKKGCNRYFDTAHALQNHFREAHARNSIANMSVSEKHVYKYRCNQCSLAFKTVEKLQLHSQYHVIRDATKCVLCGRSFRSVLSLQKHIETSHSELSEEELLAFKRSLASNPLLQANQSTALDSATAELLRKEALRTPDDDMADLEDRDSSATVVDESGHNDAENSDDSIIYKDQQFLEDYLNSQAMAEDSYNDPNRKYKCHRCKVAFTRQSYLTAHNKTLLHRKGEKLTYPMEKYLDPNRPFKCDVCKESFTQKNILLVHYNSVSHLHKLKRAMQEQQNNNNPPVSPGAGSAPSNLTLTPKSTSSEEDDRKRYKCNICKVAYTQGSTLDIHMRSVLHQTRAGKLQELAASGHVDLTRPLVEQPDRADPAKILQDVLSPKNTSPSSTSSGGPRSSPPARPGSPRSPRTGNVVCERCHASFPTGELLDAHRATSCPFNDARAHSPLGEAETAAIDEMVAKGNPPKRNSQMYKQLLETFGFDLVMQYNENQRRKMQEEREMARVPSPPPPPPEEKPPDSESKSTCQHCNKEFSSVFVLKTHCEEVHKDKVPLEFLEQFAEHFKSEYERKSGAPNSPRATSPAPQGDRSPSPRSDNNGNFNDSGSTANDAQTGALLAAQVQEMQAALNMIQLQQQLGQLHPMVAQMLSLGLPLGLNVGALAAMNLQPPLVPLMLPPPPFDAMPFAHDAQMKQQQLLQQQQQANAAAGQKRARTRITDEQLKILRAHFDINNSPSDEAIAKMAQQSGLATKVIKHWFRNTLFKERQRNKDSPYNFNNPPSTTLNLEEYEKTGEAKVTPLDSSASSDEGKPPPEKKAKIEENSIILQQEVKSEPNDEPSIEEKYNSYDDRHQEDKSFIFPQIPSQSPAPITHNNDHHHNKSRPPTPTHMSLNSLIQSQLDSIPATSIPQPPHPSMLPPKLNPSFTTPNSAPPNVLPLTPNRSLSPGRGPADFGLSGGNSNGSNSSGSSGKRANRTRFTDYQIKVLQEFFENNAYPKDDDLEYLSKLLGLSPRVIVVWFQNARQKARKVYENQPAADPPASATDDANRFQRTPGLNYQCKKCQLVFQRYYELIRHQKTHCFKEEDAKRSAQAQAAAAQVAATLSSEDSNSSNVEHHPPHVPVSPAPPRTPTPAAPNYPVSPAPPAPLTPVTPLSHVPREEKDGNFQCDKCNLVFPRFDLWREHQLVHIMNPNLFPSYPPDSPFGILQQHAQLQQLNASLGSDEARHPLVAALNQQVTKRKFEEYEEIDTGEQPKDKRLRTTILPEQLDYLYQKYQIESNPSRKMLENIAREVGLKKRVVQVWFQNTRARERKGQFRAHAQVINKRCPFCPALFKVKSALESHLSTKHADQCARGEINVDALPDEELSTESTPSFGSQQSDRQQNFSQAGAPMLPPIFPPFHSDMEKFIKQYSEESMKLYVSELQAHAAAQQNGGGNNNEQSERRPEHGKSEIPLDLSKPVDLSRPGSDADERSDTASETMEFYDDDEPTSPLTGQQQSPRAPGKRYRTQMSSLQVKIMKSLFGDYKTPTMAECEALGREIGLPKRVVQVWFQNARAKEKKARLAAGLLEISDAPPPEECRVCDFKYSHKYSVQDHVFTRGHIAAVRARLETGSGASEDSTLALMQMAARLEGGIAGELHNAFLRPQLAGNGSTANPTPLQPQPQGLIVETGNGASVLQLPATTLEQIRHIAADPGASTLRLPPPATEPPAGARELDFDLCYVCKHCKVAFPLPAPLQAHQTRSCYAGREAARGVIRVVQPVLECRTCAGERFRTVLEFRRHAETEQHLRNTISHQTSFGPPETLTHEMEDVVNQITLLAARAAQESAPPKDPNANFCVPGPRFQPPGELSLASAGH